MTAHRGRFSVQAVEEGARQIRQTLGQPARLAFAFCSPDYRPHLQDFCEILRVDGHIVDVAGCLAHGPIAGAQEFESEPGFAVLGLATEGIAPCILAGSPLPSRKAHWIALASPEMPDVEKWVQGGGEGAVAGGIASHGVTDAEGAVFLNGELHESLAVELAPPCALVPVLCQGCRPIGEPLTVTRAENNVIYALGSQPAYKALESAFETLSETERAAARGNLFAGLAGSEYVENFEAGDFLIRHILGADPSSGAVAIAAIPRVGQTLQYQFRDPAAAEAEARKALLKLQKTRGKPDASLVFSCTARGRAFFGRAHHDATLIQEILGPHPSVGFACAGEFAPLCHRNGVHSHSLVCAALYCSSPP